MNLSARSGHRSDSACSFFADADAPGAARRYDDAFLKQLIRMPSQVQCECPNHIANLLSKLIAFERYSLACNGTSRNDAAMHAMMYSASGHCRELLEEVLRRLLVRESIAEPEASSP